MVTTFLILLAGILPGVSGSARVKVLPNSNRIVVYEENSGKVQFLDLNFNHIADLEMERIPTYICEADGYIFFNYVEKDGEYFLVAIKPSMDGLKKARGVSFYYPNKFRGKLTAYDFFNTVIKGEEYPALASEFNINTMSYGDLRVFKTPVELSKFRMDPGVFWIFEHKNVALVICSNSSNIYVLDDEYLTREKFESGKVITQAKTIPITIPGGFKNPGPFAISHVMDANDAKLKYMNWSREKTRIILAWEDASRAILFAHGSAMGQKSHICQLNGSFDVQKLGTYPGIVDAALGRTIWLLERKNNSVFIKKETL